MVYAVKKIKLVKRLLDTNDKGIINHIVAIFESHSSEWWNELPEEIKKKVSKGIKEADRGEGVSHKVMKKRKQKKHII